MKYLSVVVFLLSTVLTCHGEIDPLKLERVSSTLRRLPQLNVCGLSTTEFGTKIINGRPAKLGSYPWVVAVGYRRSHTRNTYWGCGGSLVTNQHVITAAHCKTVPASQGYDIYELRLGDLNLNDNVADGASPVNVGIEEVILHEKYDNTIKLNDIAIIKMAQRVQFTELIKPICLPPPEFQRNMFVSYAPLAAGWGKTDLNGFVTDTRLMETQLTIQELDECRANVTKVLASVVIDESVICAYTPFTDTCNGDSGGPLMFPRKLRSSPSNSPGNMFLMGIVSYGYKCAQEGYPGVYTRVSHHMEWIVDHLDI